MVSIISDIIVGVSAAIVAIVVFFGLRTWRKELTGKATFDIARNIMLLGIKLDADFQRVRHPIISSMEFIDRQRKEDESKEESSLLNEWHARWTRLRPLFENLQKLQELGWEAEVVMNEESGKQVLEAIKIFKESYATLITAIEFYFEERHNEIVTGEKFSDQDYLREVRREIYPPRDDKISKAIREANTMLASALTMYVK